MSTAYIPPMDEASEAFLRRFVQRKDVLQVVYDILVAGAVVDRCHDPSMDSLDASKPDLELLKLRIRSLENVGMHSVVLFKAMLGAMRAEYGDDATDAPAAPVAAAEAV